MTEPGDTLPRDALLATKLHLPRLPPGFVARPRLTARLDEGRARPLVLVCAPAGFGIGLWVTRLLTEAMGGSISVVGQKGAGSCFTVTLPLGERNR